MASPGGLRTRPRDCKEHDRTLPPRLRGFSTAQSRAAGPATRASPARIASAESKSSAVREGPLESSVVAIKGLFKRLSASPTNPGKPAAARVFDVADLYRGPVAERQAAVDAQGLP